MRITSAFIISSFLFFSCVKEQIKSGQSYTIDGMTVDFIDFTDNRCPEGGQCIVEGEGIAYLKGTVGVESEDFNLKIGEMDTILGYVIKLDDLTPYPQEKSIPAKKKKAHLSINKL